MKKRIVTEGCAGMGKEDTMPVFFMEGKISWKLNMRKHRRKLKGKKMT